MITPKNSPQRASEVNDEAPRGPAVHIVWGRPPMDNPPPLVRALTTEGLYELRSDPAATYIAAADEGRRPASAGRTVYVTENVNEGYYPNVPKAPASLLQDVVDLFKAVGGLETHINLIYDRTTETYELYSTEIEGSSTKGRVEYLHVPHTLDRFPVAEFHSHHHMGAFFSPTDNVAELRSGVYGVIGRTRHQRPHLVMRYSCGGIFRYLLADAIFTPSIRIAHIVEEVRPRWPGQNP